MSEFRAALQALLLAIDRCQIDAKFYGSVTDSQPYEDAKALLARPEPVTDNSKLASQVRASVKWLANNAKGMSLLNWDMYSNVILRAADALDAVEIARPEPEPRITREEAMRLLDEYYLARDEARFIYQCGSTPRLTKAREACLAAMLRSEPDVTQSTATSIPRMKPRTVTLDDDDLPDAIRVRTFWSQDRKLLISAYVTRDDITLMDDNGDIFEPAGNEQTFPDAPSAPTQKECRTCYGQGCEPHETDDGRLVQGPACTACKGAGFISSDAGNVT